MDTYELYAVRYAESTQRLQCENFMHPVPEPRNGVMPMDYFVWVAVGKGRTVLIDTGVEAKKLRERGPNEPLRCPTDGLRSLNIDPAEIDTIVTTHLHWDHAGNLEKFPKARFHLQKREMQYVTGPSMNNSFLRRPFDPDQVCCFIRMLHAGRLVLLDGEAEIAPGITVHHTGGHTPGLQCVRVMTRRGWVVVASDVLHYYANYELTTPFSVAVSTIEYMEGLSLAYRLADSRDHVIAGHDPAISKMYPAVSPELEGIAVRLDVAPRPRN
jgi:glyoxylase-like metal-dependent hydrolase (beta-lactamase superfamily II)